MATDGPDGPDGRTGRTDRTDGPDGRTDRTDGPDGSDFRREILIFEILCLSILQQLPGMGTTHPNHRSPSRVLLKLCNIRIKYEIYSSASVLKPAICWLCAGFIVYSTRALAPANGHALGTRLACIILQTDDVSCSILDLSSSFSLFLTISMGIYAKTYCKKKSLRSESSPNLVQSSVYAI